MAAQPHRATRQHPPSRGARPRRDAVVAALSLTAFVLAAGYLAYHWALVGAQYLRVLLP